jgi:hypothetical protein
MGGFILAAAREGKVHREPLIQEDPSNLRPACTMHHRTRPAAAPASSSSVSVASAEAYAVSSVPRLSPPPVPIVPLEGRCQRRGAPLLRRWKGGVSVESRRRRRESREGRSCVSFCSHRRDSIHGSSLEFLKSAKIRDFHRESGGVEHRSGLTEQLFRWKQG